MNGSMKIAKGRIEEAAGAVVNNDRLRVKGQRDQNVGRVKQAVENDVRNAKADARKSVSDAKADGKRTVDRARQG